MEEAINAILSVFIFIGKIFQPILTLLDAFFGTNHNNDNDRESQTGGNIKKIKKFKRLR